MIFVNDLQHVRKFLDPIIFAEDTNVFYSNSHINDLFENAKKELANFTDWCFANKLSVDTSKTKIFFFINKRIGIIYSKITSLKFDNIILGKEVTESKILGLMVSKNLN